MSVPYFWRKAGYLFVVSLGALSLYLITLSRHYSADSLLYALAIESGSARALLDPSHLLLHPMGWLWYKLWLLAGWSAGAITPLETLNSVGGAISVALVYAIGYSLTKSRLISGIVGVGFAVSGGLWLLSVEAEFVTIPLMTALLLLWLLLAAPNSITTKPSYAILLGITLALATLTYLNSLLLVPVVFYSLWDQPGIDYVHRHRNIVRFSLTAAVIFITIFSLVFFLLRVSLWTGMTALFGHETYGVFQWLDIPQGVYAFLRTIGLYHGLALNDSTQTFLSNSTFFQRATFISYYLLIGLIASLPIIAAIVWRKRLWKDYRRQLTVIGLWSILYAIFGFYWVPGDISFWLPLLASWWLLTALVLGISITRANASPQNRLIFPIVMIIFIAFSNAAMVIIPRHDLSKNKNYERALAIADFTNPVDIVIMADDDITAINLAYFGKRAIALTNDIDQPDEKIAVELSGPISLTQDAGGQAYVYREGELVRLNP